MDKVAKTIKEMYDSRHEVCGLRKRTWLRKHRSGRVFTITVEVGDKLNDPKNKEN